MSAIAGANNMILNIVRFIACFWSIYRMSKSERRPYALDC